ncbi:MAG: glycosyltransferase family 9 protein, partial [Gemmatimonadota bacterium]
PRPWIVAYPGSSRRGSHKRWDPQRLRRALVDLHDRAGGTLLIGWGPAETEKARALAAELPDAVLLPPTTIRELTLLLGASGLYVGMDTGPMHLAVLMGTPAVGVFGRSDPVIHQPAAHLPGRSVAGPDAREWGSRERRALPPFTEPAPEAVVAAALELLAAYPRPRSA